MITARLFRELDRTGWIFLFVLAVALIYVPIGNLVLIVLLCQPSRPAETPALGLPQATRFAG